MNRLYFFLLMVLLSVTCCRKHETQNDEPEPHCVSDHALTPCELIHRTWECVNMPRPADSYNYPVCPGMEEWKSFKTSEQVAEACQIQPCVVEEMSTQAVIQAIWEYPNSIPQYFMAYESRYQSWFVNFSKSNHACMVLVEREDAAAALLERLILHNPEIHDVCWELPVLEVLISQTVFLSQLNCEQKRKIVEITLKHQELRQGRAFESTTHLLLGKTLFAAGYAPFTELVNSSEAWKWFLEGLLPDNWVNIIATGISSTTCLATKILLKRSSILAKNT